MARGQREKKKETRKTMRRVESEDAEYGENPDGEEAKGWAEFCDEGCGGKGMGF